MSDPEYVKKEKQYQRLYYLKNREKKLAYSRANRERQNELRKMHRRAKGPLSVQRRGIKEATKSEYNKRYHMEVQAEKLLRLKINALQLVANSAVPKCEKCGETDINVLCINHINGGGRKEHLVLKPNVFRKKIVDKSRETKDLNVLCCNCNIRYEYERGKRRLPRDHDAIIREEIERYEFPT